MNVLQSSIVAAVESNPAPLACSGLPSGPLGSRLLILMFGGLAGGFLALAWSLLIEFTFARLATLFWLAMTSLAACAFYLASNDTLLRALCIEDADFKMFFVPISATATVALLGLFIAAQVQRSQIGVRRPGLIVTSVMATVVANLVAWFHSDAASDIVMAVSAVLALGFAAMTRRMTQDRPLGDMLRITAMLAAYCLVYHITHLNRILGNKPLVGDVGSALELGNAFLALIGLTVLIMWFKQSGTRRFAARSVLARWQAKEHVRLSREVKKQTDALNLALAYAEEKNRQKVQTLGYVGHDLRAPMATVLGYVRLLRSARQAPNVGHLNAIERSVLYQLSLIDDVLDYAKTELQPLHMAPAPTSISELLDDLVPFARILGRTHHNRFVYQPPEQLPAQVLIDGTRLRQVLLNLLSNASKYTLRGTFGLTIDVQLNPEMSACRFTFSIQDDGIGIDMAHQASIFDAFNQLERTSGGVGLGLFIAERIVEALGGKLHLESELGKGSTFSFSTEVVVTDARLVRAKDYLDEDFDLDPPDTVAPDSEHPPASVRLELAMLARDGQITSIEEWLQTSMLTYPEFDGFYHEVREALAVLDLDRLETLALRS